VSRIRHAWVRPVRTVRTWARPQAGHHSPQSTRLLTRPPPSRPPRRHHRPVAGQPHPPLRVHL